MRKLDSRIIIALVFVVAAGLYYFYVSSKPIDTYGSMPEENVQIQEEKKSEEMQTESAAVGSASADATSAAASGDSSQPENLQKIQTWMTTESKNLDQPHVDTKQKDLELKKMVENFSDSEKKFVLESAYDSKRPANERILAAYMMVLDQSQASVENLGTLASKALPDLGTVTAHSEAEIRRGQELAVRYMAIDELVKRAANDTQALETLRTLANSGESAEVRGYVQRVLKQIK